MQRFLTAGFRQLASPGVLAAADLASYRAKLRDGLCFDYRQSQICGFPTPSSGTIALGQIFGMLESRDMAALKAHFQTAHMKVWAEERATLGLFDRNIRVFESDEGVAV